VVQSPGFEFPTTGVQAQHLAVALRLRRPHSREDKTSRLILKAALNSQRNLHIYKQKEKKRQKGTKIRIKEEESNKDSKNWKKNK